MTQEKVLNIGTIPMMGNDIMFQRHTHTIDVDIICLHFNKELYIYCFPKVSLDILLN